MTRIRLMAAIAGAGILSCLVVGAHAADTEDFDPATVAVADILSCKIDGGHYLGFTMTISSDEGPGSAKARGWVKLPTKSLFFSSYRLPEPVSVFGHATRTVAFTGSAMLAVLDLADPAPLGAQYGVSNSLGGSGGFKGERVVDQSTKVDPASGYGFKNRSALQIATNPAFPGKTLMGCSYNGELQLPESGS